MTDGLTDDQQTNRRRVWAQTYLSHRYFPLDPDPAEIDLDDVIHQLALQCRYNGACLVFLSVAEHCVRAARLAYRRGYGRRVALALLFHDGHEYAMGDLIRPLKGIRALGETFALLEARLDRALHLALGVPVGDALTDEEQAAVRECDLIMLATEKRDVVLNRAGAQAWDLPHAADEGRINPWTWERAEAEYAYAVELLYDASATSHAEIAAWAALGGDEAPDVSTPAMRWVGPPARIPGATARAHYFAARAARAEPCSVWGDRARVLDRPVCEALIHGDRGGRTRADVDGFHPSHTASFLETNPHPASAARGDEGPTRRVPAVVEPSGGGAAPVAPSQHPISPDAAANPLCLACDHQLGEHGGYDYACAAADCTCVGYAGPPATRAVAGGPPARNRIALGRAGSAAWVQSHAADAPFTMPAAAPPEADVAVTIADATGVVADETRMSIHGDIGRVTALPPTRGVPYPITITNTSGTDVPIETPWESRTLAPGETHTFCAPDRSENPTRRVSAAPATDVACVACVACGHAATMHTHPGSGCGHAGCACDAYTVSA